MKIGLTSVPVDDQEKAHGFYTEVLGFITRQDFPVGEFRWLTVVSPEDPDGTRLVLEPNNNPEYATFQKAMFDQGLPICSFSVDDVQNEFERLQGAGVVFRLEPTDVGTAWIAIFEDPCGNLLQIYKETAA